MFLNRWVDVSILVLFLLTGGIALLLQGVAKDAKGKGMRMGARAAQIPLAVAAVVNGFSLIDGFGSGAWENATASVAGPCPSSETSMRRESSANNMSLEAGYPKGPPSRCPVGAVVVRGISLELDSAPARNGRARVFAREGWISGKVYVDEVSTLR